MCNVFVSRFRRGNRRKPSEKWKIKCEKICSDQPNVEGRGERINMTKFKNFLISAMLIKNPLKLIYNSTMLNRYAVRGEILDRSTKLDEHIIIGTPGKVGIESVFGILVI